MVTESGSARTPQNDKPVISVIIPARNEERNLKRCLGSLVTQLGVRFEVIVVDDGSEDRTREIAEGFAGAEDCQFIKSNEDLCGLRVLSAESPLPAGWTGKANACWTGARVAEGEWLLFTDADTEHLPGSLAKALSEAKDHNAGLLSYSPEQVLRGIAQAVLMPVIFGELATAYRPASISDPRSGAAAANGQYLMIHKHAYNAAGGHAAVRSSLLEDVDLARLAKASGTRLRFRLGRGLVRAYMYSGWRDMRDGWTKNLALLFPDTRGLAARRALQFCVALVGLGSLVVAAINHLWVIGISSLAVTAAVLLQNIIRIRRAHFGWGPSVIALAGIPLFSWLLLRSASAHCSGEVAWKGRSYSATATSGRSGESNQ